MSEIPNNFTTPDLPPEPGTVGDLDLGVKGDFEPVIDEDNSDAVVEVNESEDVEDDH